MNDQIDFDGLSDEGLEACGGDGSRPEAERCYVDPVTKCAILGISQVIAQIEGASVLVHGPKGCAFPAYEATLYDRLSFNFSEMCERSVIFGGEKLLREKIYDTYYDNLPSLIALLSTCSSEIIGDDIDGVIGAVELPAPVLRMEGVGFKRDNWEGIGHAMTMILKHKTKQVRRKDLQNDGSINLISHVGSSIRWKDEVLPLEAALGELKRPVRRLFCNNRLADFDDAAQAAINVLVSPGVGREAAEFMQQRFGIPFVAPPLPVGLEQTVGWLDTVAKALGLDIRDELDRKADGIRVRFRDSMGRVNTRRPIEKIQSLKTVIIADPDTALAYQHFLRHELELKPRCVVLKSQAYHSTALEETRQCNPETRFVELADNMEIKELLAEERPELILCNDFEYLMTKPISDPLYINISYPGARRLKATPRSYLGFEGVLCLAEDLFNGTIERFT